MHIFFIVLVCILALALATLGLFILLRNPRAAMNRLYFALTVFTSFWIVSNYFSNNMDITRQQALWANHLALFFPGLVLLAFLGFVLNSSLVSSRHKNNFASAMPVLAAIYLLALSSLVVVNIHPDQNLYAIQFGPLAPVYFAALFFNAGLAFYILRQEIKRRTGVEKQRARIIFWSLLVTVVTCFITNALLPFFGGAYLLTNIGPMSAICIVAGSAYAILKHRLFDIHFFVVRAATYTVSVSLVTIFYIAPAVWLITYIFDIHLSPEKLVALIVFTFLLSVMYFYVRNIFDKLTTKVFFRDRYESQEVLHRLSELLVHTNDITKLQKESSKILVSTLRVRNMQYWLDENAEEELFAIFRNLPTIKQGSVLVLDGVRLYGKSEQVLSQYGIAVVVRLRTTQGILGYMTLGHKESGEAYSVQDTRLLSTAADEIAISMQNALHFEEIRNFNETLQANVAEATRKLRQTNEKLQGLDATKDEFITMASHQLRTPLTAVKGYLSMVLEGDAGKLNANQRRLLEQSYTSAQRMVYLIADLLNLSRLGTGKFVIEPTPTNLVEVVQTEIDQLEQTAASREVHLTFEHPEIFPEIMLDETKIHQVVMNFIDNAIYYTPPGGRVVVSLQETPGSVVYAVHDTGIGVPRREQRHLFTKFYRAENARQARPDGTGLGLFMAKKVVAAQGGAIIFESEEGKGSTFGFRFNKRTHQVPSAKEQVSS